MKTLVTGGARSGKSSFAEGLYQDNNDVIYLATYLDDENAKMGDNIQKHQQPRNPTWQTLDINDTISIGDGNVLLDCLSVYTSNIMSHYTKDLNYIDDTVQAQIYEHIINDIKKLLDNNSSVVIVTNEVGLATVPEDHITRVYRDILGRVNRKVASLVDEVFLVVCGCPMQIKRTNWVICEVLNNNPKV